MALSPLLVPDEVPLNVPDCVASVPSPRLVRAVAALRRSLRLLAASRSPVPPPPPAAAHSIAVAPALVRRTCSAVPSDVRPVPPLPTGTVSDKVDPAAVTVMLADPLNDTPLIVREVVRVAADPVVFWFSVGKSPATAIDGTPVVVVFFRMPVARLDRRVPLMPTTVTAPDPVASPVCVALLVTSPTYKKLPSVTAVSNCAFVPVIPTIEV